MPNLVKIPNFVRNLFAETKSLFSSLFEWSDRVVKLLDIGDWACSLLRHAEMSQVLDVLYALFR